MNSEGEVVFGYSDGADLNNGWVMQVRTQQMLIMTRIMPILAEL